MDTVGIFEAKAKLSEIVRKAERGERITITVRGRAVADIVPSESLKREKAEAAVRRLQAMPKITGVSDETIKAWIEEGRH